MQNAFPTEHVEAKPPSGEDDARRRDAHALMAVSEAAEAAGDIAAALRMPQSEARVMKMAGCAAGLVRAAERMRQDVLGHPPPRDWESEAVANGRAVERLSAERDDMRKEMGEALLGAVDVLRHCVQDGGGCDDPKARRDAIATAEGALRSFGLLPREPLPVADLPVQGNA